jgi:hypothetical protein
MVALFGWLWKGMPLQSQGTPLAMQAKVTSHGQTASASAPNRSASMFDTHVGTLDARIVRFPWTK